MKLEEIGFYTLSDKRCKNASEFSNLKRCELVLTSRCNFKCPYCRGMRKEDQGDISFQEASNIVKGWSYEGLENIRFSGGEPTVWMPLVELVKLTKQLKVKRIALSTNGSAELEFYKKLHDAGVNDFSISLDSCCASVGNKMAGVSNIWEKVTKNIKELSKITYVTVGVVLTEENQKELNDIIKFADSLGVSDIRIIPAAQVDTKLKGVKVNQPLLDKFPILKYRYTRFLSGKSVRGLKTTDNSHCSLVLDDMAVLNNKHYPCIIYMREQGSPIGSMNKAIEVVRHERKVWSEKHRCDKDPICNKNCLDVCVEYNNRRKLLEREATFVGGLS